MTIPDVQSILLPLLKLTSDQKEHSYREAIEHLANCFSLTDSDRNQLLPSGRSSIFDNRDRWAQKRLKHARLIESTRRGYFKITKRGLNILKNDLQKIDHKLLRQFPEYLEFIKSVQHNDENSNVDISTDLEKSPYVALEDSYQTMRRILMQNLLNKVKQNTPNFFEKMVVELLVKIGYGGSITDAAKAIGKSGDEGIDGVIKEDIFGLDTNYVQAKKWDSVVGRPELHKFAGALQGQRSKKGIFITIGTFSKDAIEYISKIDSRIVLIDGNRLTGLMIDNNVGVSILKNYEIKKIDSDYFTDEDVISHLSVKEFYYLKIVVLLSLKSNSRLHHYSSLSKIMLNTLL